MTQQMLHPAPVEFVGVTQAAELLDVDRATVTRWAKSGKLVPVGKLGDSPLSSLVFNANDVNRLRDVRDGVEGDVLDRVDLDAAGKDASEERSAYIREEWLKAIRYIVARTPDRTFHRGQVWRLVPDDARGPASGALITALVRQRRIEHTGDYAEAGDARNRHGSTPCKVYRVVGELP